MDTLFFFSNNINKVKEIKKLFKNTNIKIISLNDSTKTKGPKEIGQEFAENAKIKSLYGFKRFGIPCFADDSGICISALNNKPGIHSKRYLEQFESNKKAFDNILKKICNSANTNAFFITSICLTLKVGHYVIFEGRISGQITDKPRGNNGFGYDPLFIPKGQKKTFAEMSTKQKNILSHRSIAINKLKNFLIN